MPDPATAPDDKLRPPLFTDEFDLTRPRLDRTAASVSTHDVITSERKAIAERRATTEIVRPDGFYSGLALSGGGIRSASFCLGVLQALDSKGCLTRLDYLSTVSGGGYTGCSMTAGMNASGAFPFNDAEGGYSDTPSVQHIRDFSNYLIPRGLRDVVVAVGLIGRGLVANALLVAPFVLASVAILFFCYPDAVSLCGSGPMQWLVNILDGLGIGYIPGFPATTVLAILGLVFLLAWAFIKSRRTSDVALAQDTNAAAAKDAELTGPLVKAWNWIVLILAASAWLELQPILFRAYLGFQPTTGGLVWMKVADWLSTSLQTWLTRITPILSLLVPVVTVLSRNLGRAARSGDDGWMAVLRRTGAKIVLWLLAIVVPSLLLLIYLALTAAAQERTQPFWDTFGYIGGAAILSAGLACLVDPNTTSLHRLYRDRLCKAFLFDPDPAKREGIDLTQIAPKLHQIEATRCPYPIVNAALNLQGSAFANRRGRNADFFEFTPCFVGSEATGWIDAEHFAKVEPKVDLGTAMAISGAAVSPNMGSATIKPLVPTLALLNVRLGFWMRNPREAKKIPTSGERLRDIRSFLLMKELFQRVDETSTTVYVTDGGNIENLGIHALLRRRCRLIVAVDAEADPELTFSSLLKLSRYARIDFGALIDVPWQGLTERSRAVGDALAKDEAIPFGKACHVAIGEIRYGPEMKNGPELRGTLIYIKASVTGDEPDYILDYKRRNPQFPHETTGDQFFGEEQLEAYRALGFHAVRRFLEDKAPFEVAAQDGGSVEETRQRYLKVIRELLLAPKTEDAPTG